MGGDGGASDGDGGEPDGGGGEAGGDAGARGDGGEGGTERCPSELTVCGSECVDTRFNPDHCGSCNERCQLENAAPACVEGRCELARCVEGYVNQDGDPANGCEAEACQIVDTLKSVGSDELPTTCEDNKRCPSQGCCHGIVAECSADGAGGVRFSFDICSDDRKWAVCDFNGVYDFSGFDAAKGGDRILEVRFCVEEEITGGRLNLWYGQHPLRKSLPLVHGRLGVGCYVRHFNTQNALFPGWCDMPTVCWPTPNERTCTSADCNVAFESVTTQWGSNVALDTACRQDENARDGGANLPQEELEASWVKARNEYMQNKQYYPLTSTRLTLAAEECTSLTSGTIHVESVKLIASGCACSENAPCSRQSDRSHCFTKPPDICEPTGSGACSLDDLGCTGPPGPGVPCAIIVDGGTFEGITRCDRGRYVCELR
jgi:hypothetical protein